MGVPVSQMWTWRLRLEATIQGRKRYPLVLMLERCSVATWRAPLRQDPVSAHVLKQNLSPDECSARSTSVARDGVIPAASADASQIAEIVAGWSRARSTFISAPTRCCSREDRSVQAQQVPDVLVHVDGEREHHTSGLSRSGFDLALDGMREALRRGFRVTTNTRSSTAPTPTACAISSTR